MSKSSILLLAFCFLLAFFLPSVFAGTITPCGSKPIIVGYNNQGIASSYMFSFFTETDLLAGICSPPPPTHTNDLL